MEIVFLGTGTSRGVPVLDQVLEDHPWIQNPKNWRTRSSIHIVMDGVRIQVDAGPEFRIQCLQNRIPSVDLFILTHGHADHIMGMDDLRAFNNHEELGSRRLPIYASEEGLERIAVLYPYALREDIPLGYPSFSLHSMPALLTCPKGGQIRSTRLPHGEIEVLGLIFQEKSSGKRAVYYTDCKQVGEEALKLAQGADVVILDALRYRPHFTHMTIPEAVSVGQTLKAPQTYLTHLSYEVDHQAVQDNLPPGFYVAYDGLKVSI